MLELLKNRFGRSECCLLLGNWVDLTTIHPLEQSSQFRELLDLKPYRQVALYAGNMGEKQGLEIIIDAANILMYRDDLVFVLWGNCAAAERIRAMGNVFSNIRWLPVQPTEQLNSLLNLADVHLLPQRGDAADLVMPSKLTGMLASGRPVLATATPGTQIANVLADCGLTVEPGNAEAFAAAALVLFDDKDLRDRLGRRGREVAESELCMEAVLKRFEADLRKACAEE